MYLYMDNYETHDIGSVAISGNTLDDAQRRTGRYETASSWFYFTIRMPNPLNHIAGRCTHALHIRFRDNLVVWSMTWKALWMFDIIIQASEFKSRTIFYRK